MDPSGLISKPSAPTNKAAATASGGCGLSPSEVAQSWQGSGFYPGTDNYKNITLKKGKVIFAGDPFPTGYATTQSALRRADNDATKIFEGMQVKPYYKPGMAQAEYRKTMMAYEVTEDIPAAMGVTKANPQYGDGGLPQLFIPNFNDLVEDGKIKPLASQAISLKNYQVPVSKYDSMISNIAKP